MLKIMLALILVSTNVMAANEFDKTVEACVLKISERLKFENLASEVLQLKGTNKEGDCSLDIRSSRYVSGLNNLPVVMVEFVGNGYKPYTSINANEGLQTADVSKCEVTQDTIWVKASGRIKTGWKGSYHGETLLKLKDDKIVSLKMKSSKSGFWNGSSREELSCQF